MKKKVLLTSILTIALCVSLIAGSTFALFTDSTEFDIAVTSGDVEIEASASVTALYSAVGAAAADDEFLVDENDKTYTHELQTNGYFSNGGTVKLDNKRGLVLERITPGDRVDVNIKVENKSDVAIAYRYIITASDENLARGMVVTVDGKAYESLRSWTSVWYPVVPAPNGTPMAIADKPISIELPVYAGNEYQTEKEDQEDGRKAGEQTVTYTILVEAVQGNAVTDNESESTVYPTQKGMELAIANAVAGNTIYIEGGNINDFEGLYVYDDPIVIDNAGLISTDPNPEEGLVVGLTNYSDLAQDCIDVTLKNNATVATSRENQYTIFLHAASVAGNHKIVIEKGSSIKANGAGSYALFVQATTLDLYIEDASAIVATNGATAFYTYGAGNVVIHVPNATVKAQMDALIADPAYAAAPAGSITVVADWVK